MSHDEKSPGEPPSDSGGSAQGIWDRLRALEEAPRTDVGAPSDPNAGRGQGLGESIGRGEGVATPGPASRAPQPQPRSPFASDGAQFPPTEAIPASERPVPPAQNRPNAAPAAGPTQY
ncbi:MAG: hypothetical protein GX868_08200, partial [Actinobacteria bacterium]|nr:hypothetical protein [Actinomycetota bacterium]